MHHSPGGGDMPQGGKERPAGFGIWPVEEKTPD
ncbi:hypothetical protein L683_25295 [Pseudomonas aeruginosa WC55]|nr:hypothetical protein L683_25295 [Pseudomonas aeruginosa WC55]